jgi:NodT family efflux transporter outer membrane factor (OMF) lipoprotein
MFKLNLQLYVRLSIICLAIQSCTVPQLIRTNENKSVPETFIDSRDTANTSTVQWRRYFTDPYLIALIDTALQHNQELNITLQELDIARNDIRFRNGPLLPTVGARVGAGVEKVGRYTSQGAGDASTDITPGKEVPETLTDISGAVFANWEVDIWHKLRNAKKAAALRYLSTQEGRNFVITNLIAEIASSYYELLALDNQLEIVKQNVSLQKNALDIVKIQKEAARVSELAVQKFQAEVYSSQSLEFDIRQQIKENENKINFLLGRFPQTIERSKNEFLSEIPAMVSSGVPSQLLNNRPDIRRAELDLSAAKLDVKVARAEFFPSVEISAAIGLQAFKPSYLFKMPESLLYNLAGDLIAPLINRNAIEAEFYSANARQIQAMYNYERSILNAFVEVSSQLSRIENLSKSYDLKSRQVAALNSSIEISNNLFASARADYFEVLMTQRDALESKLELVETKKQQLVSVVNLYRDLGGGWR